MKKVQLIILVLISAAMTFAVNLRPFTFTGIESSKQQAQWENLMKYKLFATGLSDSTGITFQGQNVSITDESGYVGSATGNFTMVNTNHSIGGPVLFGGRFVNGDGTDSILTGPTRFKGYFSPTFNSKDKNYFVGKYCLDGGYDTANTTPGVIAGGGLLLGSATCADTSVIPSVDSTLDVPVLDTTVTYQTGITADGTKQYIYVPPETSGDSGAYNVFLKSISFGNNGKLYVVMPPEGRLTRVFVEGSITGLGGTDSTNIQVVYADSLPEWDGSKWNLTNPVAISNEDYAGNLLIYTPKDLSFGAGGKALQGSYISGGSISFAQHTHFAGQLLAKAIYIDADFSAKDFRYVPFDPPVLDIDPTALASGRFLENNTAQTVPIHLDTLASTAVSFDYCFDLDSTNTYGLASVADFDTSKTHTPVCGVDTGTINIAEGDSLPEISVQLYVVGDGLLEGTESFKMQIFNMSGAVLSGNRRSGAFTLYIQDSDNNTAPVLNDTALAIDENNAAGAVVGTLAGSDVNGSSGLRYSAIGGDTAMFSVSSAGLMTVKNVLNYEKDSLYTLTVSISDGQLYDTATVTVKVRDVNEVPSVTDASFTIGANAASGTVVGSVVASDPDTLNPAFSTLTYTIVGGAAKDKFSVDATGKVVTTATFSTAATDTLLIEVSDGSLCDTATVVVILGNNAPVLATSTLSILENSPSGTSVGTVTATDADGDSIIYTIAGGTGKSLFVIDPVTGKVTVAKDAVIDYETMGGSVSLTVIAADAFGGADTLTYSVKIEDVNEAPSITTTSFTVSESVPAGSAIGAIAAADPDTAKAFSTLTYTIVSDTSGKFVLSGSTLKLDSNQALDYEKDSVYAVTVRVTDGLLSDTATIFVHVSNVVESSAVVITRAENRDSVWMSPDTVYTNATSIDVEWKQDGSLEDSTYILHDGKNVIIITYKDPSKDKAGSDTLIVYVSTDVPEVSVTVATADSAAVSGVTIVQMKDSSDTASYVNTATPTISITATDPVTGKTTSDSIRVKLDTSITVSSSTYSALVSAVGSITLADENSLPSGTTVSHTVIGENLIEVSYEVTKNGKTYTVTYTTDSSGTRILLTDGKELYTVSSTYTDASGRAITVSCQVDGSGNVVTSTEDGKVKTSSDASDAVFTVSYVYTDSKTKDSVTVSYMTDKSGTQTVDSEGNRIYTVSYTYTDSYGNSSTESTTVIMDVKPPVVVIVSPEDGTKTSSVAVEVTWTVNGVVQDTLTMQGLSKGLNVIIRAYRDKAGNEASDTVYVFLKNGKVIDVSVEDPLVTLDSKTIEMYGSSGTTSDEAFGVSMLNGTTGDEEEILTGTTSGKTSAGSGEDPYEGLSGHLGPTLVVTAQVPSVNALGNSATLADRVEANGMISLDSGGGWDRRMVSVQDYVENYCDSSFAATVDYSDLSSAQLYKNEIFLHVWVFTSLGAYVEDYSFNVDASSGDYVDDGGLIHLYFELKPDAGGYLYDSEGKKLGTGAYIFNTSVKIKSTLQCTLPDAKLGTKRVATDDLLKLWGYRRPAK